MTVLRYTVPLENEGCKLGLFLRMQGVTAGLIKSVKHDGSGFFADDAPLHTNQPVHAGQCISFALPPEHDTLVTPQPVPFSIAYEDEFAAVLNKPAGIAVHPTLNYPAGCTICSSRGAPAFSARSTALTKTPAVLCSAPRTPLPHRCWPLRPTSATLPLCRGQCHWAAAG